MTCPKCMDEGRTSKIYGGGSGFATCMGFQPYYDETGKHHYHNPNRTTYTYTCSNGHTIMQIQSNKCPYCDWGYEQEITVK